MRREKFKWTERVALTTCMFDVRTIWRAIKLTMCKWIGVFHWAKGRRLGRPRFVRLVAAFDRCFDDEFEKVPLPMPNVTCKLEARARNVWVFRGMCLVAKYLSKLRMDVWYVLTNYIIANWWIGRWVSIFNRIRVQCFVCYPTLSVARPFPNIWNEEMRRKTCIS